MASSYRNFGFVLRWWFAAGLLCAVAANASAANVWVFTDRHHPVEAPYGTLVVELDAATTLEARLSARLPADPIRATVIVRARLHRGGAALQRNLATAYQGVVDAWSLGVSKIPAVVVDRRYVVYGIPNVARAVSIIDRYRRKHP
jgi:integrating conjugative element protein (TIGR03757 family)